MCCIIVSHWARCYCISSRFLYSINFLIQDLGTLNYPSGFWSSFALFYVVHLIVSCCSNYYLFFFFFRIARSCLPPLSPMELEDYRWDLSGFLYIYFDNDVCRSQLGREFHDGRLKLCASQVGVILLLSSGREFCSSSLLS